MKKSEAHTGNLLWTGCMFVISFMTMVILALMDAGALAYLIVFFMTGMLMVKVMYHAAFGAVAYMKEK